MPVGVLIAASRSMELGFVPLVLVGFVALYTLLFFRTPATFQRKAVVDLESGEQWSVAAQGSLWRGWPDNDGRGVSLIELQGDGQEGTAWPQQKTSCACRWCGMFALSYGVYGWSGPEFELVHVDGEGERGEALEEGGGGPWHGPNAQGCILESASPIEDPLQHGPWTWVCKD